MEEKLEDLRKSVVVKKRISDVMVLTDFNEQLQLVTRGLADSKGKFNTVIFHKKNSKERSD